MAARYAKPRYQKGRKPGSLKAAQARLVRAAGGIKRAAALTGKSKSYIQQCTDEAYPAHLSSADVLKLERAAGNAIVTGFCAHELGLMLLRLPRRRPADGLHRKIAAFASEVSAVFTAYSESIDRGWPLTDEGKGQIIDKIDEMLSAGTQLRAHLQVRNRRRGS